MKIIFLFLLLSLVSACNEVIKLNKQPELKLEQDNGSISGTVTMILGQFTISSAMAQTPADEHDELSNQLLANDFFTIYSDSDYETVVINMLADANYYETNLAGLVVSNSTSFQVADLPYGVVMAIGFNSNKKVVSMVLAPVAQDGSYNLKDSAFNTVSYYKLTFLLNNGGSPIYRQSYVFRDGKPMKSDVSYITSVASIKLSEEIGNNPSTELSSLKTKMSTYTEAVTKNLPSDSELEVQNLYVSYHYTEALNPIQQLILDSAMLHAMRSDAALKAIMLAKKAAFESYLTMARPGTLAGFCGGEGADGEILLARIDAVVEGLKLLGLIPSPSIIFIR